MKFPITITIIILAVAGGLSWQVEMRLIAARADENILILEASRLGVSGGNDDLTRSEKRVRPNLDTEAKELAAEYDREAKKWESATIIDDADDSYFKIHQRLEGIDSLRLKVFITDILTDKSLLEIMRAERALKLLPILAKKDPETALALFREFYTTIKFSPGAGNIIPECLGAWAKNDPFAAVKWIEENALEYPTAMEQSQDIIFRSAAEKDPMIAFSLIEHLQLNSEKAYSAMLMVVTAAKTHEDRDITLAAFREFRDANEDNKEIAQAVDQTFGYFSWSLAEVGFDAATKWIDGAKLSPWELDRVCARLSLNYDGDEPAQWIEWMGARFPLAQGDSHVMDMFRCWTHQDYEAAGNWLASAPENPTKKAAIRSYAQAIFPHDPAAAVQWLMTLPPGRDRDETFKTIHMNWPKDDPAGKEAFKQQHGIK